MITLPELAIKRHVTTLMLIISMVVLGSVALLRLPLAFLPDMDDPELYVRIPYAAASPQQIDTLVLRPMEEALASVDGLESMWARCDDDAATVRLEFAWGADLNQKRVEIWEKIDRIRRDLPDDLDDITLGTSWRSRESDSPVLEIRLSSNLDLSESYDLLERRIVRPLLRLPGVAQVALDGVMPREVRINLRLADLELHQIDVRQISQLLRSGNFNQSLGEVTEGDAKFLLRTLGTFESVDQIREFPLRADGLKLSDVADVVYREPELDFGRHLDGNYAVGITVSAEANANVVEVCKNLQDRIRAMDSDPELQGVNFLVWHDQGKEIEKTIRELIFTGVFGAILASLVLFVFLRRISTTVISVLCIPFALIVTCGVLWANGETLNTLSLLGLIVGVGMLVDNAVVVIENIFRHQEMGEDRKTSALKGSREVSTAVIAATLTSVIVFLPMIFNKPSRFSIPLKEIGLTVCLTLLASLFISQTLIPLATSWFIRAKKRPRERWLVWLETHYERLMKFNLKHRWLSIIVLLVMGGSMVFPFMKVDFNFDPDKPDLYAQIEYRFYDDMTLDAKEELVTKMEKLIDPLREELKIKSHYSWWSDRFTMTRVYLRDGEASPEQLDYLKKRLEKILPEFPGVLLRMRQPGESWRRNRGKKVTFRIVGEDPAKLKELAEEGLYRISQVPGLTNPYTTEGDGQLELRVDLDSRLVAQYSVSPQRLAESVGLTFRGRRLPRFRTPQGEREMRLTLDETEEESVAQLSTLPVWNEEGQILPLASIATFTPTRGPERIERDDRTTNIWVGASYKEGTKEDYVPLVEEALKGWVLPDGYRWNFGSWRDRLKKQTMEFGVNLGLALLLIFAVMASLFESVRQAIALMISLPFALSGAYWTLYLAGNDFDHPAGVGLLLLIGIVVNNGIVMIEHINSYRRTGMERSQALLKGGKERLRPILMTAVTTLLGLLPIVIKKPALGGMYYYSMALVIMGGIIVSTFLTAVLLPATVTLVEDSLAWVGRLFVKPR